MTANDSVLDKNSRLKDSEIFSKVILSLDLSKKDREDCEKLLADKLVEVGQMGGSNEGAIWIGGQPGAFHVVAYRRALE